MTKYLDDIVIVDGKESLAEMEAAFIERRADTITSETFSYFYERCGMFLKDAINTTYNDVLTGRILTANYANKRLHYWPMDKAIANFFNEGGYFGGNRLTEFVKKVLYDKLLKDHSPRSTLSHGPFPRPLLPLPN